MPVDVFLDISLKDAFFVILTSHRILRALSFGKTYNMFCLIGYNKDIIIADARKFCGYLVVGHSAVKQLQTKSSDFYDFT